MIFVDLTSVIYSLLVWCKYNLTNLCQQSPSRLITYLNESYIFRIFELYLSSMSRIFELVFRINYFSGQV